MKKQIILLFAACVLVSSLTLRAQSRNAEGGISDDMLVTLRSYYEGTPSDKAIKNALAGTSIATLAINAENAAMIDTHFTDKVRTKGITNQKSSGRCWLFTGLNVLRARMIDKYDLPGMEFSQNYLFFYDQLEKANLFLQGIIDTRDLPDDDRTVVNFFSHPIGDGGHFTGVSDLITKYGLVPSEAMPETFCSNNTSQMATLLGRKLREDGLALREYAASADTRSKRALAETESALLKMKESMLGEIYRMLVLCLGEPPTEFEWVRCDKDGEVVSRATYTPKSFYDEFIGEDLEGNYVLIMNNPCREYGKVYEVEFDRHVYDGENWRYLNLPMDRIKELAIASIKDNTAMYFSCDVGKYSIRSKGTLDLDNYDYESLVGMSFNMDKRQRVLTHASTSSHAMTLIGVDIDPESNEPVKWLVENSWGADSGYKGCMVMTDEWFCEYMFRLVVEKKYVPSDILGMLDQTPVLLPAWSPVFLPDSGDAPEFSFE